MKFPESPARKVMREHAAALRRVNDLPCPACGHLVSHHAINFPTPGQCQVGDCPCSAALVVAERDRQQEAAATTPVPQEDDTMPESCDHVWDGSVCHRCGITYMDSKDVSDPTPDPAPDPTANLRTLLDSLDWGSASLDRSAYRVLAALDFGAVLVAPDAPLAQRLTQQELADLAAVLDEQRYPSGPWMVTADGAARARLRAALPTTGEER